MTVTSRSLGSGRYRLLLTLRTGWETPGLRAVVTILTDDPQQPTAILRVTGFIRR